MKLMPLGQDLTDSAAFVWCRSGYNHMGYGRAFFPRLRETGGRPVESSFSEATCSNQNQHLVIFLHLQSSIDHLRGEMLRGLRLQTLPLP